MTGRYNRIIGGSMTERYNKGAARKYGNRPKRQRLEITSEILEATLNLSHDDITIYVAFCTAGFLRIGEFTWSAWDNFESFLQSPSREPIQFVRDGVILQLPASKTDSFRKGVSIPLYPSGDITSTVSALSNITHGLRRRLCFLR
jgi:hypothetical protein